MRVAFSAYRASRSDERGGVIAKRAGKEVPAHPLWALSWSAFGAKPRAPGLGDVLVFTGSGGGHEGRGAKARRIPDWVVDAYMKFVTRGSKG